MHLRITPPKRATSLKKRSDGIIILTISSKRGLILLAAPWRGGGGVGRDTKQALEPLNASRYPEEPSTQSTTPQPDRAAPAAPHPPAAPAPSDPPLRAPPPRQWGRREEEAAAAGGGHLAAGRRDGSRRGEGTGTAVPTGWHSAQRTAPGIRADGSGPLVALPGRILPPPLLAEQPR